MYQLINKVKEVNPLVLHYTNEVTINDCANITLALGASPLMSYSYEEVDGIVNIASAVVINIGTMNSNRLDLFVQAGKAANKFNKPVILDPVGVFATKTRADFTNRLLNEIKFDVVKGNVSEIKYIGGFDVRGKGVDSFDDGEDITEVIKKVAKKLECVVVATGKTDFISDGEKVIKIDNGTTKLKSVTGTGCMIASLIGSYLGASNDKLNSAAMGVLTMSLSGELADKNNISIGSFKTELMNNIYEMNEEKLRKYGRVK
ncbi:hydroxyethylthiazole kinase [Clostridium chauvoei]|uniref:Hydroxyethylthiazole kinase n=2 Tax=Clostridium chauvoei TaxID=46867 RepID=S6FB14_9CLOT|nr:hydroxyethylthiazole kinase [Clostridium chauvoei]ATD55537.1 hydroxyethylthiazole kinase [Clostridium chauvoei]ATD56787.1 hydroxyethylthiazole kinase [Clostridium chauvoei]MBX7281225.1 hydroxyethylthiazole kinase [Clostridium chauvoei]MBX7283707.1 hydroxyethylthiazole kinase [Clostridium chauvoei]MBX7286315.1 hydroxyethylthiazole kinase [Clostridium chauvoei]